jgi:hypothetical protein
MRIRPGLDATALLREAIYLYPDHLSLRWMEATLALERGDTETARPLLEHLAAIDPDTFFDPFVAYDKAIFRHLAKEALALCFFREGRFAARDSIGAASTRPTANPAIKARLAERALSAEQAGSGAPALPEEAHGRAASIVMKQKARVADPDRHADIIFRHGSARPASRGQSQSEADRQERTRRLSGAAAFQSVAKTRLRRR